jgi:hypothetical protein
MIEIAPKEYWKTDLNWYEAKMYCFCLDIDGKTGWHLPDMNYFHTNKVTRAVNDWYWTSEDLGSDAMQVRPYGMHFIEWDKNDAGPAVTMPVRDLKDN